VCWKQDLFILYFQVQNYSFSVELPNSLLFFAVKIKSELSSIWLKKNYKNKWLYIEDSDFSKRKKIAKTILCVSVWPFIQLPEETKRQFLYYNEIYLLPYFYPAGLFAIWEYRFNMIFIVKGEKLKR